MIEARLAIWDSAACRRVHEATLEVIAETGDEVRYAAVAEILARAGAHVDGTRTLLDRLKTRVAELRSGPRAFELSDDTKAGLDHVLAEVEAHRPGT